MARPKETTAIVFGDPTYLKSVLLTEATLRLAHQSNGLRVAAICDSLERVPPSRAAGASCRIIQPVLEKLFDPTAPFVVHRAMFRDLYSVGRRYDIEVITPPGRNINAPRFVKDLQDRFNPSFGLSFGCPQVFGRDLLGIFKAVLNNHNGLLPAYRGWAATEWSIYHGESTTGSTYHIMTPEVDAGPILCVGEIPIGTRSLKQIQIEKYKLATSLLEVALKALLAGDPGRPQTGEAQSFGRKGTREITTIGEPSYVTWPELQRRLQAFGSLWLTLDGEAYMVTKLKRLASTTKVHRPRRFITKDGVPVAATRFVWLPFQLFRCLPHRILVERRTRQGLGSMTVAKVSTDREGVANKTNGQRP